MCCTACLVDNEKVIMFCMFLSQTCKNMLFLVIKFIYVVLCMLCIICLSRNHWCTLTDSLIWVVNLKNIIIVPLTTQYERTLMKLFS